MTTQDLATIEEAQDLIVENATGATALNDFKRAREIAAVIVSELEPLGVFVDIGKGKEKQRHLTIRGWQMIGSWLGITSQIESTTRLVDEKGHFWGYQAIGVATRRGEVVGRSSARCLVEEQNWKAKPEFTLESMAETRAQSKALRSVCGPIVWMANTIEGRISDVPISDSPAEINIGRDGINEGGRMAAAGNLADFAENELGLQAVEPENYAPWDEAPKATAPQAKTPAADKSELPGKKEIAGTANLAAVPLPANFKCPYNHCTDPAYAKGISLSQRDGADVKGGDNFGVDVIKCNAKLTDDSWCNKEWPRTQWLERVQGSK